MVVADVAAKSALPPQSEQLLLTHRRLAAWHCLAIALGGALLLQLWGKL